ncbi:MAG: FkbM family methyltransferase [Gammaproteobacteria bacterium]|nr:FkbM family methyltransferase [Gammaproteobacteria bacterium]
MDLRNALTLQVAKVRELNKLVRRLLPEHAYIALPNGVHFFVYPRDLSGPSIHVIKRGFFNYENIEIETLLTFLPEDGVMLDVGANVGVFAMRAWLAKPQAEIFCFEPEPSVNGCLARTVRENGIGNIHVSDLALSATSGTSTLFVHDANSGGHSLKPLSAEERAAAEAISVTTSTLDDFVAAQGISHIDVIKVDIQEAEVDFITGGAGSLRRLRPVLMLEITCADFLHDENILTHLQQQTGMAYRVCDHNGKAFTDRQAITRYCEERLSRGKQQSNFFFIPKEASAGNSTD